MRRIFLSCALALVGTFALANDTLNVYKVQYLVKVKMDEAKIAQLPSHIQEKLKEQLGQPRYFELLTNGNISSYSYLNPGKNENTTTDENRMEGNKKISQTTQVNVVSDFFYKDIESGKLYKKTIIGEKELVVDLSDNVKIDWEISDETKKAGNYEARKATYNSPEGQITAWYIPEISIVDGPEIYNGLPGLIVEVETPKKTITLNKIEELTDKKIEIPKFSKILTLEEFNKEMEAFQKPQINSFSENGDGIQRRTTVIRSND